MGKLEGKVARLASEGDDHAAPARFMAPDDVARTLLAVAGTLQALPGIGVDHLVISSPSPPAASFMEAFTALGTDQGETDG